MADKNIKLKDGSDYLFPQTKLENIVDLDDLDPKDLSSGSATNGQVPIANGSGGIAWGTPSGGEGGLQGYTVTIGASPNSHEIKLVYLDTSLIPHYVSVGSTATSVQNVYKICEIHLQRTSSSFETYVRCSSATAVIFTSIYGVAYMTTVESQLPVGGDRIVYNDHDGIVLENCTLSFNETGGGN